MKLQDVEGIPKVFNFGSSDFTIFLEMELLGGNYKKFLEKGKKHEIASILELGIQVINIL
jgi:hypothetical protein